MYDYYLFDYYEIFNAHYEEIFKLTNPDEEVDNSIQGEHNGELCTWFDKLEFSFFPLEKNYTFLFV